MSGSSQQDFCVKWGLHPSSILNSFDKLRTSEILTDVTLAADGQFARAHRVVLSACSTYFQEIFAYQPERNVVIFLKDVSGEEMQALIQYMYKGQVHVSEAQLPVFLKTAQSLRINGIVQTREAEEDVEPSTRAIPNLATNERRNIMTPTVQGKGKRQAPITNLVPSKTLAAFIKIPISRFNPTSLNSNSKTTSKGMRSPLIACKVTEDSTLKPSQEEELAIMELAEEFRSDEKKDEDNSGDTDINVGDHQHCEEGDSEDSQHYDMETTLGRHQRITTGEHACDECPYRAKYSHSLKRHKRRMHRTGEDIDTRYKCDNCPRDYKSQEYLYRHQRYECGKEPKFACPHCGFRCFWRADYRKHISRIHSNLPGTLR